VNTGGGGGGAGFPASTFTGSGAGGSGVVIVSEPAGPYTASGIWDMNALYDNVKAGTWV
jgi:hypothetical protein